MTPCAGSDRRVKDDLNVRVWGRCGRCDAPVRTTMDGRAVFHPAARGVSVAAPVAKGDTGATS